jgi:hypothetical protein
MKGQVLLELANQESFDKKVVIDILQLIDEAFVSSIQ